MPSRAIASGTVTFGLVSIPIRVFVATHSEQVSFHMLHEKCGTRVRQQLYCPHDERVVERCQRLGYGDAAADRAGLVASAAARRAGWLFSLYCDVCRRGRRDNRRFAWELAHRATLLQGMAGA